MVGTGGGFAGGSRDIKVPLRGRLLKEGGETVRMRVGDGWDIDIYKAMILTVEKDGMALIPA